MIYLLDSNFFIQSHRDTYPLDVVVSFWKKFKTLAINGTLISIDKVSQELNPSSHPDELAQWCCGELPSGFFKETDTNQVVAEYQKIMQWAVNKSNHYLPGAITEFMSSTEADAFLIAYALANKNNITIVTHESSNPNIKKKIKIPEVCNDFGIKFCTTIQMFRELKETF
ncbi:MAG: DUF4411 family protein [Neisseriales bacterium]|nr:MAG: DUF4411 family protein [Neisseriales bacterium]